MKTAFVVMLLVGVSSAAVQQRSPVYQPSVTSTGSTTPNVNSAPFIKSSPVVSPSVSTPPPVNYPVPVAEARESVGSDGTMIQSQAGNPASTAPSQNYYVYYYPHQQTGAVVGQPNSSSIWNWGRWNDVAAGVGSIALVAIGGGILYSRYGKEAKTRALRELQNLSADDAARMARSVLRALEKFSAMNNNME